MLEPKIFLNFATEPEFLYRLLSSFLILVFLDQACPLCSPRHHPNKCKNIFNPKILLICGLWAKFCGLRSFHSGQVCSRTGVPHAARNTFLRKKSIVFFIKILLEFARQYFDWTFIFSFSYF